MFKPCNFVKIIYSPIFKLLSLPHAGVN